MTKFSVYLLPVIYTYIHIPLKYIPVHINYKQSVLNISLLKMLSVFFIIAVILTKELVMATEQCNKYQFKSPFYPGESCEDIHNMNIESHDKSGYYWILDGPKKVYCGMTYTGSSCEDIYNNNPETGDKLGYYRINDTQWVYCIPTYMCWCGRRMEKNCQCRYQHRK